MRLRARAGMVTAALLVSACKRSAQIEAQEKAKAAAVEAEEKKKLAAEQAADAAASEDTPSPVDLSSLPSKIAAIAADPEKAALEPRGKLDDGRLFATIDVPGCTALSFGWDPKKKDVWSFTGLCPDLKPNDLAGPGGVDALDDQYMVITSGPLAGVFADRNFIDVRIWRIATVPWRMLGDASMFVFCAEHRVPGRTFMSEPDFLARCDERIVKRMGLPYCRYDPKTATSGYDCGRTWNVEARCSKDMLTDEDTVEVKRRFTCVYDAAKPEVRLDFAK